MFNILVQASVISVIAVGLTFVIISGGIDLSVGSIVAFSGMVLGHLLELKTPIVISVTACLATGLFCGAIRNYLKTRSKAESHS